MLTSPPEGFNNMYKPIVAKETDIHILKSTFLILKIDKIIGTRITLTLVINADLLGVVCIKP